VLNLGLWQVPGRVVRWGAQAGVRDFDIGSPAGGAGGKWRAGAQGHHLGR